MEGSASDMLDVNQVVQCGVVVVGGHRKWMLEHCDKADSRSGAKAVSGVDN
jgi:hypothetical protein